MSEMAEFVRAPSASASALQAAPLNPPTVAKVTSSTYPSVAASLSTQVPSNVLTPVWEPRLNAVETALANLTSPAGTGLINTINKRIESAESLMKMHTCQNLLTQKLNQVRINRIEAAISPAYRFDPQKVGAEELEYQESRMYDKASVR